MSSARVDLVDIELVYAQEMEYELIGSETRTANGDFMSNVDAFKRRWMLQTRPMLKCDRDTLVSYLESVFYGPVEFWLDEFGMDTVTAYVTEIAEIHEFTVPDRYSLTLTIEEE